MTIVGHAQKLEPIVQYISLRNIMSSNIKSFLLLPLLILLGQGIATSDRHQDSEEITLRHYCTEIGRFDLLFYEDEVSGSYALLPKKSLGAVWGKLENQEMKGRWVDADGTGDIIIQFDEDLTFFSTAYRSDDEPDKWYRDSWNGHLRPDQGPKFSIEGKTYQCE